MRLTAATVLAAFAISSPSASAHHAFGAEFDPNLPLQLRGPIVRIEWVNPHAWFHVEHTNEDGTKTVWMVEAGTPNTLFRRGITRTTVPVGTLTIRAAPSAPARCLPAPCLPFSATWRGLCRKSIRVLIPLLAMRMTLPPVPPSPPSGPPRGTYFSRRKLMHPLPPLPALT